MSALIRKPRTRSTLSALAVIVIAAVSGCGGEAPPTSSSPPTHNPSPGVSSEPDLSNGPSVPAKTEARLRQIATTTPTALYYLGAAFHGWPLDDAIIFSEGTEAVGDESLDPGQTLSVGYGNYCAEDSCAPRVEVTSQAADAVGLTQAQGCSRLRPVRGVPTVAFQRAGTVFLFTSDQALSVGSTPPDVKLAAEAATALRRVGEDGPTGAPLPPPPPAKIPLIDKACGPSPGEHGPDMSGEQDPQVTALPDFTVPRIGGGQLRLADYAGKPVVVVAGDVTQVAPTVRHLAKLTSGGKSPAVIGLIWDPFGNKEHPTPIADIQRKAGVLPVPVGYPATYPAVWLLDTSAIDPNQSGVIGFLNGKGVPVTLIPTDASDTKIRAAIRQLH
jgi:hypothetical protein